MPNDLILDEAELGKIDRFTRRPVTADEVYAFPLVLCDNAPDRDGERFSVRALERLAELFVGKTGIFDHDPKGENQTARIYECEVRSDETEHTACGEPYTYLYAKAYMMRTERSRDLITEIEGGIKKEVSVSCSIGKRICSICGSDREEHPCGHVKGRRYEGKLCCDILDEPGDAYEWSFVAVPAQPGAGVVKHYGSAPTPETEAEALKKSLAEERALNDRACDLLRREIIALSFITRPIMAVEAVKALTDRMSFDELAALRGKLLEMTRTVPDELPDEQQLFHTAQSSPDPDPSYKI